MSKDFQKELSRPEARHRYWHIYKAERDFFPDTDEIFVIEFDKKKYNMKVNHKNDVMTGQLYERYRFLENDRIIITKKKKNHYSLDAPDTKLYPEV